MDIMTCSLARRVMRPMALPLAACRSSLAPFRAWGQMQFGQPSGQHHRITLGRLWRALGISTVMVAQTSCLRLRGKENKTDARELFFSTSVQQMARVRVPLGLHKANVRVVYLALLFLLFQIWKDLKSHVSWSAHLRFNSALREKVAFTFSTAMEAPSRIPQ